VARTYFLLTLLNPSLIVLELRRWKTQTLIGKERMCLIAAQSSLALTECQDFWLAWAE